MDVYVWIFWISIGVFIAIAAAATRVCFNLPPVLLRSKHMGLPTSEINECGTYIKIDGRLEKVFFRSNGIRIGCAAVSYDTLRAIWAVAEERIATDRARANEPHIHGPEQYTRQP